MGLTHSTDEFESVDPYSVEWFHGRITREEAEEKLKQLAYLDGTFLLREKLETSGSYVLSVIHESEIFHYPIERTSDHRVKIENGRAFNGPVELIENYMKRQDGLITKLMTPCFRGTNIPPKGFMSINIDRAYLNAMVTDAVKRDQQRKRKPRYLYEQMILKKFHKNQSWYRHCTRREAEEALKSNSNKGANFILRKGKSSRAPYVLSVKCKDQIKHYMINEENGMFSLRTVNGVKTRKFGSLVQLIDFYCKIEQDNLTKLSISNQDENEKDVHEDNEPEKGLHSNNLLSKISVPDSNFYEQLKIDHLWINEEDIEIKDELGSGCYGIVFYGIYHKITKYGIQNFPVAIKTLKINKDSDQVINELMPEVQCLKLLNHTNIIKMIGLTKSATNGYMVILELAPLGSLKSFLKSNVDFPPLEILNLLYQIACGMAYLASMNIVHRDLAARNVLLVTTSHCKISDFGLSRLMTEENFYEAKHRERWPLKWYPPEAIRIGRFHEKSDIWSYGITMWESLKYGAMPYADIPISVVMTMIERGYRLECPEICPAEVYTIMKNCWNKEPKERPFFKTIVEEMSTYNMQF